MITPQAFALLTAIVDWTVASLIVIAIGGLCLAAYDGRHGERFAGAYWLMLAAGAAYGLVKILAG